MENNNFMEIANSPILWIITGIAVGLVLIQSVVFLKKSINAGKNMNLSDEQMKTAFKTGTISAIGPSIVIVVGMISLLVTVGGPTALMRLAYIGNVVYELLAVGFAADAYGVGRTAADITPEVFATALWCMAFGCIGWIVFTNLVTHKLDKVRDKMAGGKQALIPIISTAAMLGAYGYFNAGYIISMDNNTIAFTVGLVSMTVIILLFRKTKKKWLNEWGLSISMFLGMIIAGLL